MSPSDGTSHTDSAPHGKNGKYRGQRKAALRMKRKRERSPQQRRQNLRTLIDYRSERHRGNDLRVRQQAPNYNLFRRNGPKIADALCKNPYRKDAFIRGERKSQRGYKTRKCAAQQDKCGRLPIRESAYERPCQ